MVPQQPQHYPTLTEVSVIEPDSSSWTTEPRFCLWFMAGLLVSPHLQGLSWPYVGNLSLLDPCMRSSPKSRRNRVSKVIKMTRWEKPDRGRASLSLTSHPDLFSCSKTLLFPSPVVCQCVVMLITMQSRTFQKPPPIILLSFSLSQELK